MFLNYDAVMKSIFSYKNECAELSRKISEQTFKMLAYYKELKELRKKYNFYQNTKEVKNINSLYDKKHFEQIKAIMVFLLYSETIEDERYNFAYQLLYENLVVIDVPPSELDEFSKELISAKEKDFEFTETDTIFMDARKNQISVPNEILEDEDFLRTLYGIYNGIDPEEKPF